MRLPRRALQWVGAVAVAAVAAGGRSGGGAATPANPGASWQKVSPAAVGLDAAKLAQIAAQAERGKSNCLVVVRDGKLAGEWYFRGTGPNTAQDVFSATKSVASTLVGIAQDDGDLQHRRQRVEVDPAVEGHSRRQAVTVRDLLSMDSGRQWSAFTTTSRLLARATARPSRSASTRPRRPAQVWAYNNSAVQTLDRVLQEATGQNVVAFAQQRLFAPLGMTHTTMTTDAAGNAQMFEGIRSTCRDLARFGVAHARPRAWGTASGSSPSSWVARATGALLDAS